MVITPKNICGKPQTLAEYAIIRKAGSVAQETKANGCRFDIRNIVRVSLVKFLFLTPRGCDVLYYSIANNRPRAGAQLLH